MDNLVSALAAATDGDDGVVAAPPPAKKARTGGRSKKGADIPREKRLEQNRKAAIESRRRKKVMVDELKRSVHFYTKANTNLKAQNADLERQLLMAKQAILFKKESADSKAASVKPAAPVMSKFPLPMMDMSAFVAASSIGKKSKQDIESEAMQAQFAATQALYASMGYPSAAARAAASTFASVSAPVSPPEVKEPTKMTNPPITTSTALQSNPFANFLGMPNSASDMKSMGASSPDFTSNSCMDMDRIEELNQFAMQQAAAANAAAATATAAIKAANFHRQMKGSASKAMPMFFPFFQFPGFQAP
eukprot:scaffold2548_cov147-Skeletonema_menzelii.AAC.2